MHERLFLRLDDDPLHGPESNLPAGTLRPLKDCVAVVTGASRGELARTESPRYLGRAVAALAGDARVLEKSGEVLRVADLAREYGFTDIDGRQVAAFEMQVGP